MTLLTSLLNPQTNINFQGSISAAADFPTLAYVQVGYSYNILVNVTDNNPAKTNTGQSFLAGDEIFWNGTNWTIFGPTNGVVGPVSATDNGVVLFDGTSGRIIKDSGVLLSAKANSGANSDITSLTAVNTINIQPAPSTDLTVSGQIITLTAGENLAFGDIVYIKSDGKMWKADANAAGAFPIQFMAIATILTDASGSFLVMGIARNDAWTWTVGGPIYLSTTPGGMTQTAPAVTDDCIQVLGFATHADRIFFKPSVDYITST